MSSWGMPLYWLCYQSGALGDEGVGGVVGVRGPGEALPLATIIATRANGCLTITQCEPQL
jgi:hypothetical protein